MAAFQEGQVNIEVNLLYAGQVKTAQAGRRGGEDKSELERMLEEGWVETSAYEEGKEMASAYADFLPEDVIGIYAENWAKSGDNTIALAATRKSKEWEKEFGGDL